MIIVCPQCLRKNNLPQNIAVSDAQCGECERDLWSSIPITLNDQNFMNIIPNTEILVLVDFWADWCNPCKSFAPTFTLLAKTYKTIQFAKVNTETSPKLSQFFQIRSIPCLMLFQQTKQLGRVNGAMTASQLESWLQQLNIHKSE